MGVVALIQDEERFKDIQKTSLHSLPLSWRSYKVDCVYCICAGLCVTDSSDLKYCLEHLGQIELDILNKSNDMVEF